MLVENKKSWWTRAASTRQPQCTQGLRRQPGEAGFLRRESKSNKKGTSLAVRWTGVSETSRSCWEGWTGDLKHERWASVHTESRQTQASLLPETGSLAKLHAAPGPLHRLVLPQRSFPALHTVSSSLSLAVISPVAQMAKNLPAVQETWVSSLGREDPLEKGMAAHSSNLVWRIPWTEEPGGLQSTGL